MIQSGHIVAQNAQPIHKLSSVTSTGLCPFLLIFPFANARIFFGHASTQSPHPLQRSVLKVSFAILFPFRILTAAKCGIFRILFVVFGLKRKCKQTMHPVGKHRNQLAAHRCHFNRKSAHDGQPFDFGQRFKYGFRRCFLPQI